MKTQYERVEQYIDRYESKKASRKLKNKDYGYLYRVRVPKLKQFNNKSFYKGNIETLKEARTIRDNFIYETTHHIYKDECNLTLNDVYIEWLDLTTETQNLRPQTIKTYIHQYNRLSKEVKESYIVDISYKELQNGFNKLEVRTTNKILKACLVSIYDYAIKQEYINNNIARLIEVNTPPKKKKNAEEEYFKEEDFKMLFNDLMNSNKFSVKGYAIAIAIGYYTGLRIGEILALEKGDIDFNTNMITVNKQVYSLNTKKDGVKPMPCKTSKSNAIIPLQADLKEILIQWFNYSPYEIIVSDCSGKYVYYYMIENAVRYHANKLGLDNFHFHMLRTTFITNVYKNTGDLKTVQELARHESINTSLNIYTVLPFETLKDAINKAFNQDCYKIDAKNENQTRLN